MDHTLWEQKVTYIKPENPNRMCSKWNKINDAKQHSEQVQIRLLLDIIIEMASSHSLTQAAQNKIYSVSYNAVHDQTCGESKKW